MDRAKCLGRAPRVKHLFRFVFFLDGGEKTNFFFPLNKSTGSGGASSFIPLKLKNVAFLTHVYIQDSLHTPLAISLSSSHMCGRTLCTILSPPIHVRSVVLSVTLLSCCPRGDLQGRSQVFIVGKTGHRLPVVCAVVKQHH